MDAAGALSCSQPINWPAFRDTWLTVAHGIAQSGMPAVLLGPFIPGICKNSPHAAGSRTSISSCSTALMSYGVPASAPPSLAKPRHRGTSRIRPVAPPQHHRSCRHQQRNPARHRSGHRRLDRTPPYGSQPDASTNMTARSRSRGGPGQDAGERDRLGQGGLDQAARFRHRQLHERLGRRARNFPRTAASWGTNGRSSSVDSHS